jgi:hypothetical protein
MELYIATTGQGLGGLPCPRRLERFERLELLERATLIAEWFGSLDDAFASCDHRAIREKIETELKIRKWFQNLTRLST